MPQLLIWVCRFLILLFSYTYHDWPSLFTLLWICHSALIHSQKSFSIQTKKFYLPIMILIVLAYYLINIDGMLKPSTFQTDRIWIAGVFRFVYPTAEILTM